MNDDTIRELKVDELENVVGGGWYDTVAGWYNQVFGSGSTMRVIRKWL
jgi:hypothetical protein